MWSGVILVVLYMVIVTGPLLLLTALREHSPNLLIYEIARSFGLTGFVILAMQPVLVARLKWIERPFGMDMLSRFHKSMGVFVTVMVLSHPPLMALGGAGFSLVISPEQPWYIWAGRLGLVLLLIHTLISVFSHNLGLKFEQWRRAHYILAPLIIVIVFIHSWETGDDLKLTIIRIMWVALLAAAALAYLYHKLVIPSWLNRHRYKVTAVQPESYNVWTVKLAPPEGEKIYKYYPGQFHFITFYRGRGLPVEEHHWTISSSPTQEGFVSSTIKESGDFTSTIGRTQAGDEAGVQGPFGRFSYAFYPEEKEFVFIAGGIGITPLMSMLRHMQDTRADVEVLLLYANRAEKDIVFQKELAEIEAGERPRLKVVHILSQPDAGWTGETGYVDREKVEHFSAGRLADKAFYVCGPPVMSVKVIETLRAMGVPYDRIHTEIFSL